MKKEEEIYIVYEQNCMLYDTKNLHSVEIPSNKKSFCGAVAPLEKLISHSILLPCSDIEDSEAIEIQVELSLYEEAGLDRSKEYIIGYLPFSIHKKSLCHIEAFAIDKRAIEEILEPFTTNHPAIDIVTIPSLLYKVFYADGILERSQEVEIFLRIDQKSSLIALYYQGEFITTRQIPSLEQIARRLEVDLDWLIDHIYNYGFDEDRWSEDEIELFYYLQESFYEILYRVNYRLRQKIEKLGLKAPKIIWIDDDNGVIPKLELLLDTLGYEQSIKKTLPKPELFSSLHPYLEARYTLLVSQGFLPHTPNLTPFPRRPKWYQTHTGRLGITLGATLIFLLAIDSGNSMLLEKQTLHLKELEKKAKLLQHRRKKYKVNWKSIKKEIASKKEKIKKLQKIEKSWRESAMLAKLMRDNSLLRHKIEKDVDRALAKEEIKVSHFKEIGSNRIIVDITVPTLQRYKLAAFMEDLKEKGYRTVDTALIKREDTHFHSKIEVSR